MGDYVNKKGFTLVELLAVIVILAVIMIITIPTVLGNMKEARQQAFNTVGETMKKYLVDNYNNCKLGNKDIAKYDDDLFDNECSFKNDKMQQLIEKSGYSTENIKKVEITDDGRGNFGVYIHPENDGKFYDVKKQLTNSIPNKPDLSTGLVPVKYDGSNWVVTTATDPEWFDYSKQKWANAVSLKDSSKNKTNELLVIDTDVYAMFVWIPRFSYTIGCTSVNSCLGYKIEGASDLETATPGAIDIRFVPNDVYDDPGVLEATPVYPKYNYNKDSNGFPTQDRNPDNWYIHPAFDFGGESLSGIWVGKFETTGTVAVPTILPNNLSLTDKSVSVMFETSKKFSVFENIYGIDNNTDAHMMKNSEWGAVAYLSQSIYGKYGNSDYTEKNKEIYKNNSGSTNQWERYTGRSQGFAPATSSYSYEGTCRYNEDGENRTIGTGSCGAGSSTTGNIYGIYDMVGGSYEYLTGNYNKTIFNSGFDISNITSAENEKYFNIFESSNPTEEECNSTVGFAFCETREWYSDYVAEYSDLKPWLGRGGYDEDGNGSGIFSMRAGSGGGGGVSSFRSVLVKK